VIDVTPHTFRRTYITIMLAAGFDLPYVQDQVGHTHPSTTLGIYAQVVRRPDRDTVRAEMRALLGEKHPAMAVGIAPVGAPAPSHRDDLSTEREARER
jgi:site-specific recombinase XerD